MRDPIQFLPPWLLHKQYVLESSTVLIKYLYENNRPEDALSLAKKCAKHDNSKFEGEEIAGFIKLDKSRRSMMDSNEEITEDIKKVIETHWKNNRHHPEHFKSYKEMNEIDIMEMVCDWYSRSRQFGTDFLPFVKARQANRFHFDEDFFNKVYFYCELISQGTPDGVKKENA